MGFPERKLGVQWRFVGRYFGLTNVVNTFRLTEKVEKMLLIVRCLSGSSETMEEQLV